MAIYEHATEFAGKLVVDWDADTGIYKPNTIYDPAEAVYAIRLEYEEERAGQHWTDKFALFLDDPAVSQITGIVVGNYPQWHERTPANSALSGYCWLTSYSASCCNLWSHF